MRSGFVFEKGVPIAGLPLTSLLGEPFHLLLFFRFALSAASIPAIISVPPPHAANEHPRACSIYFAASRFRLSLSFSRLSSSSFSSLGRTLLLLVHRDERETHARKLPSHPTLLFPRSFLHSECRTTTQTLLPIPLLFHRCLPEYLSLFISLSSALFPRTTTRSSFLLSLLSAKSTMQNDAIDGFGSAGSVRLSRTSLPPVLLYVPLFPPNRYPGPATFAETPLRVDYTRLRIDSDTVPSR